MRVLSAVVIGCFVTSCAKSREPAPTEMSEVVRYAFVHYEDDVLLAEALDNLKPWLLENAASEDSIEGFVLGPLTEEEVLAVPSRPSDAIASEQLGAAGGNVSRFGLMDQVQHIVLDDQVFTNPKSFVVYDRSIEGDIDAFLAGSGRINTVNQVTTEKVGVKIPYQLNKDFKWVKGEHAESVIARSWVEDRACNDAENNCLAQSYSIDLFMADDSGGTLRFTTTWNQLDAIVQFGDDYLISQLSKGLQDVFNSTEEYLEQ